MIIFDKQLNENNLAGADYIFPAFLTKSAKDMKL